MRKTISRLALAAVAVLLLGSCAEINERIDKLESKIGGIENETIKSIDGQISAINSSIADLGSIRSSIQSLTQTAGSQDGDIENLQKADKALGERIDSLSAYVNGELVNYAKTEWVNATFSTLAQYEETCDTIAKIDARIGALDTRLSGEIAAVVDSLSWINARFGSYYTAAQMDAKLEVLQAAIDSTDAENKAQADSIAAELTAAKAAVDSAKANIRAEYRAAVDTAITALDGKLSKALQDSIAAVNNEIDHLTGWVKAIDDAVYALMGRVDKLEKMIQSVVIVPAYSDGSVKMKLDSLFIDCIVSPADAVKNLTKDNVKLLISTVKTKAVNVVTVSLAESDIFEKDETNGTLSIKANISGKVPAASGNAITVAVKVQNGISKYTTDFVPVYEKVPAEALRGVFSVSPTKKVHFSKGNLVASVNASGNATAWKFASHQYDYVGNASGNATIGTEAGEVDLFGWSTSTNGGNSTTDNYGINTSEGSSDYPGNFYDWGKAYCISNSIAEDTWRTLSKDEWTYLFNTRSASTVSGNADARYAKATVNNKAGIILLPDTYEHPSGVTALTSINTNNAVFTINNYTVTDWGKMESAGAVFLPAAGYRNGSTVSYVGANGYYRSSTENGEGFAYIVNFSSSSVNLGTSGNRSYGYSVRLITEVPEE